MLLILFSHEKIKRLISVSVQKLLNHTYIHLESRTKTSKKRPIVAGIGINQEKWAIFVVADALAPRIASSPIAMVLTKKDHRPIRCGQLPLCMCIIVA